MANVRVWLWVMVAITLGMGACQREKPPADTNRSAIPVALADVPLVAETVEWETADGWRLTGTYWFAGPGKPAAVLLHMLPADRRSYDAFGPVIAAAGFNTLALDSRGHGDSRDFKGEARDYHDFDEAAYASSVEDITAARALLEGKGADCSRLVIVGASIGANFALVYGARDADVKAIALLSPGLDYHGVKTEEAMKAYNPRPAFLVASEDDADSAACVRRLKELNAGATLRIYAAAGHGTNIFGAEPKLQDELAAWLGKSAK